MELEKLFASVGLSVQQAQEALEQHEVERYMGYFLPPEDGGEVKPKTLCFSVGSGQDACVEIPLAVMTPHAFIGLKQVKVTISGEVYADEQAQRAMMRVGSNKNTEGHNGSVELIFESGPQPEGQARATQKMLSRIAF